MKGQIAKDRVIYQADPNLVKKLTDISDGMQKTLELCMHRYVRVQMAYGQTLEGMVVGYDRSHLYLCISVSSVMQRQWMGPSYSSYYYDNVILPLVLFELLVIVLLS